MANWEILNHRGIKINPLSPRLVLEDTSPQFELGLAFLQYLGSKVKSDPINPLHYFSEIHWNISRQWTTIGLSASTCRMSEWSCCEVDILRGKSRPRYNINHWFSASLDTLYAPDGKDESYFDVTCVVSRRSRFLTCLDNLHWWYLSGEDKYDIISTFKNSLPS